MKVSRVRKRVIARLSNSCFSLSDYLGFLPELHRSYDLLFREFLNR